jgi:hypothetical protein
MDGANGAASHRAVEGAHREVVVLRLAEGAFGQVGSTCVALLGLGP